MPDECVRLMVGTTAEPVAVRVARQRPCMICAHRHDGDGHATHVWGDTCGYDAGADCPGPGLRPLRLVRHSAADTRRYDELLRAGAVAQPEAPAAPTVTPVVFAPYLGPWLPEHVCPGCGVERADYEGPGAYLDRCPNCGATEAPIEG